MRKAKVVFRTEAELNRMSNDELQAHYFATILNRHAEDSDALRNYQSSVLAMLDKRFGGFLSWPGNWSYSWVLE